VQNNNFESGLCKEALKEGIGDSDGRDVQNVWKRLDVFYSMCTSVHSNLLVLRYAMYALGLFEPFFVKRHAGVLNV
jgi:hypothetical protein